MHECVEKYYCSNTLISKKIKYFFVLHIQQIKLSFFHAQDLRLFGNKNIRDLRLFGGEGQTEGFLETIIDRILAFEAKYANTYDVLAGDPLSFVSGE